MLGVSDGIVSEVEVPTYEWNMGAKRVWMGTCMNEKWWEGTRRVAGEIGFVQVPSSRLKIAPRARVR